MFYWVRQPTRRSEGPLLTPPLTTNLKVAERVDIDVNRGMVAGHHNTVRDHCMPSHA